MQDNLDALHAANGTAADTDSSTRTNLISQLFFNNYAALTAVAYEAYPGLLVWDCDRILTQLGQRLGRYKGPLAQEPFMRWAERFVTKEAERYAITTRILTEYRKVIFKAISDNLWNSAQDRATEHADIFAEVMLLVFRKAHALNRKGTAKESTRVYGLVKKHVFLFHNTRNKRRREAVARHLAQLGELACETFTPEELESISHDGISEGYAEAGLSLV